MTISQPFLSVRAPPVRTFDLIVPPDSDSWTLPSTEVFLLHEPKATTTWQRLAIIAEHACHESNGSQS